MLRVENLQKRFRELRAVDGVSFQVAKGEVVGLLGPNGAGKTTTMRLITGFLEPDAGQITLDGIDAAADPLRARRQIGYLPENAPSYHEMETTEFLVYIGRLRKIPKDELTPRMKEAIEMCGLGPAVGRQIGELSRGFKQRVALAQALMHHPRLLILDEPTTGLDPHQIQEIRELIRAIGRERTVILSTHIMQEVQAVCSRALIIAQGKLVGQGTLEELTTRSRGGARYFVKVRADLRQVREHLPQLEGISLAETRPSNGNGTWHHLTLLSESKEDLSESIFRWVVAHHWSLGELRMESHSLENVFLELTRGNE